MMTSRTPYETYREMVINRAKFDVYTSSSFANVKAHVRTHVQTEQWFTYQILALLDV